ncbi:MAG: DUF4434 domain-containing protein [Victivallaceae bacterium]|nr:DUF4434 domain-containing protein [Victivallaceae bacterium]
MLISGSWFEFQHNGGQEAPNWNPYFRDFTPAQWEALLSDMAGIGMEYIVLMGSALDNKTFYKSRHFESYPLATEDPMQVMFDAADKLGIRIFVSNDFYGSWMYPEKMFFDPEVRQRRELAMAEIVERFGHHKSFYGWYWPNELDIYPNYSELFIEYCRNCKRFADSLLAGKKALIAPYGTFHLFVDDKFLDQLDRLEVDFVAYQDEIGVRKANIEWTPFYFERLKQAHDKVGKAELWADMEVFQFEGPIYKTPLHPAPIERILKQLEGISPFVERVLIYQYPGLMSKPGTIARHATPEATRLYSEYNAYREAYLKR